MTRAEWNQGEDLVTLLTKSTEFEAQAVVAVLKDAGVDAWAFGAGSAMLPLGQRFTGVPVQVRSHDVSRAEAALAQRIADSVDLDWDSVDVGDRQDELPLRPVGRMPWAARLGYVLAVALLAATVLGWLLMVGRVI